MIFNQSLWHSLASSTRQMAQNALADVKNLKDWEQLRPVLVKEFMHNLGLDPMPPACEPNIREQGEFSGEGYRARKIAFQILPDCWSAATFYYPQKLKAGDAPAAGVLYVCGHAGLSMYHYQYHPIMWARRGYVCLILETIEQADNSGEHHGSAMNQLDHWLSLGYTPAGTETFNAMRAIDILAADPLVDAQKLGVTGVSGGGACSFHVAMADERIKAVSTVCGISTPVDAVQNRHLLGHCDCMYPQNLYGRDISTYAALLAPRAAVFCFADHDPLYHPDETRALVERTRKIYALYGKEEDCTLVTSPGMHADHPPFGETTSRVFDQHLAGQARSILPRGLRENDEQTVDIFQGLPPVPNYLRLLPELIATQGQTPLPTEPSQWPQIRKDALSVLRKCAPGLPQAGNNEGGFTRTGQWLANIDLEARAFRGSIDGQELWLQLMVPKEGCRRMVISVVNAGQSYAHGMVRQSHGISYGSFEPRFAGFNAPASERPPHPPGTSFLTVQTLLLRAMALTGVTPVQLTIRDILALTEFLASDSEFRAYEIYFHGKADSAVAALYAGLLDDRIAGVFLENLPSSHRDAAPILGVLRAFDIPQAVGLMAPRKVALINQGHGFWTWPGRAFERMGCKKNLVMAEDFHAASKALWED